jgi:RNA-directed DNA polymerase
VIAGSRSLNVNNNPWSVNTNIGSRFACDTYSHKNMSEQNLHISDSVESQRVSPESPYSNERRLPWCAEEGIFSQIFSYENLLLAWSKTQKLRRYRPDVVKFRANLDENLIEIQNSLIWECYTVGEYRNFYVHEPKKRLVSALPLRDRVVQHAINNVVEPLVDKTFFFDSHACRAGHGTTLAVKKAHKFSRRNSAVLKCDVSQFFASINHTTLIKLFERKIRCERTLKLVKTIIDSTQCPGIPIGNLLSQLSANLYLHELDRFVKHDLAVRDYCRYMDDFLLFCDTKAQADHLFGLVEHFLSSNLQLKLSRKKCRSYSTKAGFPFCGSMVFSSHTKILNKTVSRNRKKLRKMVNLVRQSKLDPEHVVNTMEAILGHCLHSRNYSYRLSLSDAIIQTKGNKEDGNAISRQN